MTTIAVLVTLAAAVIGAEMYLRWRVIESNRKDVAISSMILYANSMGRLNPNEAILNRAKTNSTGYFRWSGLDGIGPGEDEVAVNLTPYIGTVPVTRFRDPNAIPARPYGMFVTKRFIDAPESMRKLQAKVRDDMIAGVLPPIGGLMLRLLYLKSPIIVASGERNWKRRAEFR